MTAENRVGFTLLAFLLLGLAGWIVFRSTTGAWAVAASYVSVIGLIGTLLAVVVAVARRF